MRIKTTYSFLFFFLFATGALAQNAANPARNPVSTSDNLATFQNTWQCPRCNLTKADLSGFSTTAIAKTLVGADCSKELSLAQADLSYALLTNSNFSACLRGVVTPFRHIDFNYANLSHAQLTDSVFYGVSFIYANLPNAQLQRAHLDLSDFTRANFSHAQLNQAQSKPDAMHGWGSNFYLANFCGADLTQANLYGYFRGANFSLAKLNHATLTTSDDTIPANIPHLQRLTGASLWSGIDFKDADLTGAHFYTTDQKPADISQAAFCRTIMPDGSINNRDCH